MDQKPEKTLFFAFSNVQIVDCWKYNHFHGLSKSVDKNAKFGNLNYKYDEVSSEKILSACNNFKCSKYEIRGGSPVGPPH